MRKLDRTCPGEYECQNNKVTGEIGGLHGIREKRTLENYCHDKPATKDNKLKAGCPLFATKPENVPPSLIGAIEAAELLRRYKQHGLLPPISELSAWEFCCFDTAESASNEVEAEAMKEATANTTTTGTDSPMGKMGEVGEDSAMKNW